tara:strand:+ start:166 stop:1488 length:1323 start_codon:yes stop_codon:yes gene_type:complete
MRINDFNRRVIERILKKQKFFLVDDVPWQWFNYESGKWFKNSNIHTRCDFLFTDYGFFAETLKEVDDDYIELEKRKREDYSYYHRQKRYIAQEMIDTNGVFNNPIHISAKPMDSRKVIEWQKGKFESVEYIRKVKDCEALELSNIKKPPHTWLIICHPGYTRLRTSCFLQQNIKKCILTMNKKDHQDKMTENFKELKTPDDFLKLWTPHNHHWSNTEERWGNFYFHNSQNHPDITNGTKFHKQTECNVLKLWRLSDTDTPMETHSNDFNHTQIYLDEVFKSSTGIAKTMFEKTLTIYTNSNLDVEKILNQNREHLIYYANFIKDISATKLNQNPTLILTNIDLIKQFKFEVKFVENKPIDIASYNKNKGFAIWIDKDMVECINREIYELLYYTRWDIKSAATKDGKVEVVNCSTKFDNKWVIEDSFFQIDQYLDEERWWL